MPPTPGSSKISGSSKAFSIAPARGAGAIEELRTLFREYRDFLGDVQLPGYDDEIALVPGKYVPPKGEILLARASDGMALGCIAVQPLPDGAGEVKRLFVRDAGRGMGLGKALIRAIEAEARRIGYRELRLDTLPRLVPAVTLYRSLGFDYVDRYNDNPNATVVFLAKRLDP